MKCLLKSVIAASLLLVLFAAPASAQTRIATVDLRKLFDGYWKTKQADAALKDRQADMVKEGKAMEDEYKKGQEDYKQLLADANDQAVSAETREKRKAAAEAKLKELKVSEEQIAQYRRQMGATLGEQQRRMRENILSEIRTTVNARAKTASYSLVVDISAETQNGTPIVLYSNGDNDLTEAVLSQLNAVAPEEKPKADGKK